MGSGTRFSAFLSCLLDCGIVLILKDLFTLHKLADYVVFGH